MSIASPTSKAKQHLPDSTQGIFGLLTDAIIRSQNCRGERNYIAAPFSPDDQIDLSELSYMP